MHRGIGKILRTQANKNNYIYHVGQDAANAIRMKTTFSIKHELLQQRTMQQVHKMFKHGSKKQQSEEEYSSDSDNEDSDGDDIDAQFIAQKSKILEKKVDSLRLDVVLKNVLGISRNKIDEAFYNSNLRLNEQRVLKKSALVLTGDKIDLVRNRLPNNPKLLSVSRVVLLKAIPDEDCIRIKVARDKALTIEDYTDPWKGTNS